ncbi:MAG: bifunctional ADP-heptose synthase [Candidatus Rokubacteria bacterium]|nr:bifunctional ADP-heptose synthase [Candidatus Rokubacteria bacterium]
MFPAARLSAAIGRLSEASVVVIGDLITDEYLFGKPARISREAPVLILRFSEREVCLGGAANAAHNVAVLGARVLPVGVVGEDAAADDLRTLLTRAGIATDGLVPTRARPTPVKTRIMAGGYQSSRQQVVRLDREPDTPIPPDVEDRLIDRIQRLGARVSAFLISDYGYGTVTPRVLASVRELARASGAVVTADSRYDLLRFTGVTAATPNEPEVEALTGTVCADGPAVEKAGWQVLDRLDARYLLVTRGSRGMALFERGGPATFLPVHGHDEIADVTGAGDTVISTFTVALASGADAGLAAWLANVAGGVVVMKRGTATASPGELLAALPSDGRPPRD